MKYHIGNFEQELVENHKLVKHGDLILFNVNGKELTYSVRDDYVNNCHGYNDEIFVLLHLDKTEFAKNAYGYYPHGDGVWPFFSYSDYNAATRLIINLFREIERISKKVQKSSYLQQLPTLPVPSEVSGGSVKINIPKTIQSFSIKL